MEKKDYYVYTGDIHRDGYLDITNALKVRQHTKGLSKEAVVCIATYGGDPNAGYRIGRALQHSYESLTLIVVGPCKSAGTLMAIAANRLVIGDMGELGPLDIQLKKNDEIGEMSSGLAIMTALDALKDRSISAFNHFLVQIKYENQISTKLSADIATRLTKALITPMAAQIDPIKLGEHQRAMNIAITYGQRLSEKSSSLKEGALVKLIASYPSHGFVIDRGEAKNLFQNVTAPDGSEDTLYSFYCQKVHSGELQIHGKPKVSDITEAFNKIVNDQEEASHANEPSAADDRAEQDAGRADEAKPQSSKRGRKPDEEKSV